MQSKATNVFRSVIQCLGYSDVTLDLMVSPHGYLTLYALPPSRFSGAWLCPPIVPCIYPPVAPLSYLWAFGCVPCILSHTAVPALDVCAV